MPSRSVTRRLGLLLLLGLALCPPLAACDEADEPSVCTSGAASCPNADVEADELGGDDTLVRADSDDDDGSEVSADTSASPDSGLPDTLTAQDADAGDDSAIASDDAAADGSQPPQLTATEANEGEARFGWIVAGQPSEQRLAEVVAAGAVIISLLPATQEPFDEEGLIAALGGTFVRYPTAAAQFDDVAFREAMYDLYDAQRNAGERVYLHCASGNRAGASWALYLAERLGVPGEEAIAEARSVGLTSLESTVRLLLGL